MATQMSIWDSASHKAEYSGGVRDIPLIILMKKYGLSDDAQASIVHTLSKLPFLVDSPSVNYGRATIVEAYWVVEICVESKYCTILFSDLEREAPEIFADYFEKARRADFIFQANRNETTWMELVKPWSMAQTDLWRLIKSAVYKHQLRLLDSPSFNEISKIMEKI